jgi:hypothetical protein
MKLKFDHSFTSDQNHRFRNKLEKAGFKLEKHMVEHPGKHFCKFIYISVTKKAGYQYLEFIHTGKGGKDYGIPGVSLGAQEPLEPYSKKLKAKKIEVKLVHKNYDWKKNDKDRLPGWNFLDFPKHKSKIFTWLTEYEKRKKRKSFKKTGFNHPNQVYKMVGLEAIFDTNDEALYSKMCGKPSKNEFILACGTNLSYQKGKKSRVSTIVLATKDLNKLVKKFKWDELTTYKGKPGVLIKNPDKRMWDVVIIQG